LLFTLFLLVAFLLYSRFREQGGSPGYLCVSIFAAALAMLSKETAVMFPWILIAYEAMREMPSGMTRRWRQFAWTLPYFAVVGTYGIVRTVLFGRNLGPGAGGSRTAALVDAPLVLITYLRNLVWSFRLSFFYPSEWAANWSFLKAFGILLVLAITVLLWKYYRDRPAVQLQLLWMAIFFVLPVLGVITFVKEDWIHDRHMYLVSVPFCLLIAALLTDPKLPRKASIAVSAVILLVLSLETAVQVPRFSDGISIFESALQVAPRNALAHRYFAFALCSYGRYEEAFREYRITAELRPWDPAAYGSYAEALSEVGRDDDAATEYEKALQRAPASSPYRAFLLYRLASIKLKNVRSAEGEGYLREAIQISPDTPSYHAVLAQALRQQGRAQEADQQMQLEASVQKNLARAQRTP
jgi:tetratricopeptide (TPR) repeat protein